MHGIPPGYAQLMLLDSRFSDSELRRRLPINAKWADADFLMRLLQQVESNEDKYISLKETSCSPMTDFFQDCESRDINSAGSKRILFGFVRCLKLMITLSPGK